MTSATPVPESTSTAADPAGTSLKSRVVSGSMWTILSYGSSQVLRLAGNLIFAQLLFPAAFGLMALVNVFVQGLVMFSDVGIGPSIVQSKRGEDVAFLNTAWTIQVVRGFILWIVSLVCARPFAAWYGEPQLAELIPVAALGSILSSFNSTRLFTSHRKIALGRNTLIDFVSQVLGMLTMLVWCFITRGVWAIVFGGLVGSASKMILSHVALQGERNRFTFDREAFQELSRFGRWVFVSTSLSFLTTQIDRLMLGKFVPIDLFGVYSLAGTLAAVPPILASALTGIVLFPLFAHHSRTDLDAYARSIFAMRRLILEWCMFLFAGLVLVSPTFFRALYDERYANAAWITQMLTIPMWTWILTLSADRAVLAVGESRTLALSNAASLLGKLVACYAGFHLAGMIGFILGLALGNLTGHVPIVLSLRRRGINILRQDLAYTSIAVSLIGGAVVVQQWGVAAVNHAWIPWVEIGVASALLVPLGLRAVKCAREVLAHR